jgi:hypothetical protein
MNSSESEHITDEIIGEAVLSLLKTNRPINTPALLVKLRLMQATEMNRPRRNAIIAVIEEISARLAEYRKDAPVIKKINGRWENRAVFARGSVVPGSKKIH